jgi:hypothetical protein
MLLLASLGRALMRMPELTRRRSTDAPEECWHVYYGDVHAGTIAIRSGSPYDEDPWEWTCSAIGPRANMKCGQLAKSCHRKSPAL